MDCRKLLWLGGLAVAGLIGCRTTDSVHSDPQGAMTPEVAQTRTPLPKRPSSVKPQPEESKTLDAKPVNIVKIATVQSEAAFDESRTTEERQNNYRLAAQNFRRATQLDPKCTPAHVGLARLYSGMGDHEAAVKTLDEALAKLPNDPNLWHDRGMVLGRLKRFEESLADLKKAAGLEPDNAVYAKSVGMMLARHGRGEEAITWLKRSMSEADARYNVARIMKHIGREEEVRQQLQRALQADPEHQPSLAMLSEGSQPAPAGGVRQVAHREEAPPALKVVVDQPTPVVAAKEPAPAPAPAPVVRDFRPPPPIPMLSDQRDGRPSLPPSLETKAQREPARGRGAVRLEFAPNP